MLAGRAATTLDLACPRRTAIDSLVLARRATDARDVAGRRHPAVHTTFACVALIADHAARHTWRARDSSLPVLIDHTGAARTDSPCCQTCHARRRWCIDHARVGRRIARRRVDNPAVAARVTAATPAAARCGREPAPSEHHDTEYGPPHVTMIGDGLAQVNGEPDQLYAARGVIVTRTPPRGSGPRPPPAGVVSCAGNARS